MNPMPAIKSDSQEQIYVLGVDTVEFSKRTDRQQYVIFRDLIDGLRYQEHISSQDPGDVCVLLTGDGFFVCLRGARNRLTPLRLAVSFRHDFANLRTYALRFGVNAGPATWITMQDDTAYVISHAVNWTARVMGASSAGQLLLSGSYYETYVLPAVDELFGMSFSPIDKGVTKHGEPLRLWEVEAAAGGSP